MVLVVVVAVVVVNLFICLSASLKTKLFYETSSVFELDNVKTKEFWETSSIFEVGKSKNETILRDFLIFRSWQHQKRSNSARLPWKMESWVQSWRPRTNAFCDFSTPPVYSIAPATKKWSQVIRSAAPVTQNHLPQNWRSDAPKYSEMQPLSGNQRPDLLTALMNMSLVLRLPRERHLAR